MIRTANELAPGDEIVTLFGKGRASSRVEEVERDNSVLVELASQEGRGDRSR